MARQRFQAGLGGTLRLALEDPAGQPTAVTISIQSTLGADLPTPVVDAAATVTQKTETLSEFSYALSGAQCPAPAAIGSQLALEDEPASELPQGYGHSYRAVWTYTLGGQQHQVDQLYEVRLRVLRPTLTSDQVERQLPAQWEDLVVGGAEEIAAILADAWDDLLDEVEARGFDPDRIMDAGRLLKPHRSLVVWTLAKTWGNAWREWATDRKKDADQDLEDALNSGGWYDKRVDNVQTPAEVKWTSIRLTR